MSNPPLHPTVRDVELSFLRKGWWLFPVLGALASLALGGPFWQWVEGTDPFPLPWERLFSLRAGAFALAFLAIPAAWRIGLKRKGSLPLVSLAVVICVWAADLFLQMPLVQGPLWLAARSRLDAGQSFMREVCYVRLEEAAGRASDEPAIVLMGSSQMLHGVDDRLLRELMTPMPVIRRSMFGMTPLKTLSMLAYVPFRAGDVCVQYLSELDFSEKDEFPFAWFRPYASWKTVPDVLRCVPPSVRVWRWRQEVDYVLAATFESWRSRDFLRQIVFHFWRLGETAASDPGPRDVEALVEEARAAPLLSDAKRQAFHRFAQELDRRQVGLVVFEGEVHPALHSPERLQAKATIRDELAAFAGMKDYRYVSSQELGLSWTEVHFLDSVHLNRGGQDRLTRRMAQELLRDSIGSGAESE